MCGFSNCNAAVLSGVREELGSLQARLPMYADWQIPALRNNCARYTTLLIRIALLDNYRRACTELLRSLPIIQDYIINTVRTGDWRSFNRAATTLDADLSDLIAILD